MKDKDFLDSNAIYQPGFRILPEEANKEGRESPKSIDFRTPPSDPVNREVRNERPSERSQPLGPSDICDGCNAAESSQPSPNTESRFTEPGPKQEESEAPLTPSSTEDTGRGTNRKKSFSEGYGDHIGPKVQQHKLPYSNAMPHTGRTEKTRLAAASLPGSVTSGFHDATISQPSVLPQPLEVSFPFYLGALIFVSILHHAFFTILLLRLCYLCFFFVVPAPGKRKYGVFLLKRVGVFLQGMFQKRNETAEETLRPKKSV